MSLIITVAGVYNYQFNLNCVPIIYIELVEGGVATQTTCVCVRMALLSYSQTEDASEGGKKESKTS